MRSNEVLPSLADSLTFQGKLLKRGTSQERWNRWYEEFLLNRFLDVTHEPGITRYLTLVSRYIQDPMSQGVTVTPYDLPASVCDFYLRTPLSTSWNLPHPFVRPSSRIWEIRLILLIVLLAWFCKLVQHRWQSHPLRKVLDSGRCTTWGTRGTPLFYIERAHPNHFVSYLGGSDGGRSPSAS